MNNDKTEELLPNRKSKKNKTLIFIIIGIAIVILLAIALFFFFNNNNQEEYTKNLEIGQKYLEDGDYDQAIIAFQDAIKINKKEPEAFEYLAQSAVLAEDYPIALEAYDNLIDLSENKVPPTLGKAEVYIAEGSFDKAEELLKTLEDEYSENQDVLYTLNNFESGNNPNNIINGGDVAYDISGNLYFITYDSDSSINGSDSILKINQYNFETKELKTLIEENSNNGSLTNLSIWNERIYYNLSTPQTSSIVSCNLYGTDRKIVSEDYYLKYIYKGKLFVQDKPIINSQNQNNKNIIFRSLNIDGTLDKEFNTGLPNNAYFSDEWLVTNNSIYYVYKNTSNYQVQLMQYNLDSQENTNLASTSYQDDYEMVNGIYCYGDTIYYSFSYDEYIYFYNIATKQNTLLSISGPDKEWGFTVSDKYFIKGNKDSEQILIFDKENQSLIKTIDTNNFESNVDERWPSQSLTSSGVYLTPTAIILNPSYFYTTNGDSDWVYYNNYYEINLDNWSGNLIYKAK